VKRRKKGSFRPSFSESQKEGETDHREDQPRRDWGGDDKGSGINSENKSNRYHQGIKNNQVSKEEAVGKLEGEEEKGQVEKEDIEAKGYPSERSCCQDKESNLSDSGGKRPFSNRAFSFQRVFSIKLPVDEVVKKISARGEETKRNECLTHFEENRCLKDLSPEENGSK